MFKKLSIAIIIFLLLTTSTTFAQRYAGVGDWLQRSSGYINVKAKGVTGNGTTNDATALQNIITNANPGTTLYFPRGTYRCTSTITITAAHRVNLVGDGQYSQIFMDGSSTLIHYDGSGGAVRDCFIRDLYLASNSTTAETSCLKLEVATGTYIENVLIRGAKWGIHVYGSLRVTMTHVKTDTTGLISAITPSQMDWGLYSESRSGVSNNAMELNNCQFRGPICYGGLYLSDSNGEGNFVINGGVCEGSVKYGMWITGIGQPWAINTHHFEAGNTNYNTTSYRWDLSGSGTSEYYCLTSAGANPGITESPNGVWFGDDNTRSLGKLGNIGYLAAGEFAYGDNDSNGFNTLYVRVPASVDPDTLDKVAPNAYQICNYGTGLEVTSSTQGSINDVYITNVLILDGSSNVKIAGGRITHIDIDANNRMVKLENVRKGIGSWNISPSTLDAVNNYSVKSSTYGDIELFGGVSRYYGDNLCSGDLETWGGGLPTGFAKRGSPTLDQETTYVCFSSNSAKITKASTGQEGIEYDITATKLADWMLRDSINIECGAYDWTQSLGSGNEYYLQTIDGQDPHILEPTTVLLNSWTATRKGTQRSPTESIGSLSASTWHYGSHASDSLTYNTIYVRLSDDTNPDTKANGYVKATYRYITLTVSVWIYKPYTTVGSPAIWLSNYKFGSGSLSDTTQQSFDIPYETWTRCNVTFQVSPVNTNVKVGVGMYSGAIGSILYVDGIVIMPGSQSSPVFMP